jgi:hypothetical protein
MRERGPPEPADKQSVNGIFTTRRHCFPRKPNSKLRRAPSLILHRRNSRAVNPRVLTRMTSGQSLGNSTRFDRREAKHYATCNQ